MIGNLLLAAAMQFTPADANVSYAAASNLVVRFTPRVAGSPSAYRAAHWILDTISIYGANAKRVRFNEMTPIGQRSFINIISDFRGHPDAPWTVLVSHFDTKELGTPKDPKSARICPGANDGASTSGLLIALAKAMCDRGTPTRNVILLWTDGEECRNAYGPKDGLWGSRYAAGELRLRNISIDSVICLDMLGDRDLHMTIPSNGNDGVADELIAAARRIGLGEDKVRKGTSPVIDDHVPFLEEGLPAIDLIDCEYGSAPGLNDYWHTPQDTLDKISINSLETAGKLIVEFLNRPVPGLVIENPADSTNDVKKVEGVRSEKK